jgi:hypothetical protein
MRTEGRRNITKPSLRIFSKALEKGLKYNEFQANTSCPATADICIASKSYSTAGQNACH